MITSTKKTIFLICGIISFVLGFIGAFLPILPTTPFMLLAAYFFSKGSPKLHQWLLSTKAFGPIIRDWQERGAINLRTKIIATIMMVLLFSYTIIFVPVSSYIKIVVCLTGLSIQAFIWTRPSE